MVLTLKIPLKKIQTIKNKLSSNKLLNHKYLIAKDENFLYLPIKKRREVEKLCPKLSIIQKKLPVKKIKETLWTTLSKKLTKKEYKLVPRTHEIVGNIMILEMPKELKNKEKLIAESVIVTHKQINTVLKKSEPHKGVYRTRKLIHLAGKKKKTTIHKENGLKMKIQLEKMYFSVRLATERMRITKQIKKGETVLVMFSGCGPYPLTIRKHSQAEHITAIEINPAAHQYAVENSKLNNLNKIDFIQGDVNKILPNLKSKKFDRIIMPLPKTGQDFLDLALKHIKKGGIVNYYTFLEEKEKEEEKRKLKKICKENKKICQINKISLCGQQGPKQFRMCFDIKVS